MFVFFFQAEDGIRDFHVTGVQTCALPISRIVVGGSFIALGINGLYFFLSIAPMAGGSPPVGCVPAAPLVMLGLAALVLTSDFGEIGRASCRERGEVSGAAVTFTSKLEVIR